MTYRLSWYAPSSLFMAPLVLLIHMASRTCLAFWWDSLSMIFAPSQSMMCFSCVWWSVVPDLWTVLSDVFSSERVYFLPFGNSLISFMCSSKWVPNSLPVSPIHSHNSCMGSCTPLHLCLWSQFCIWGTPVSDTVSCEVSWPLRLLAYAWPCLQLLRDPGHKVLITTCLLVFSFSSFFLSLFFLFFPCLCSLTFLMVQLG